MRQAGGGRSCGQTPYELPMVGSLPAPIRFLAAIWAGTVGWMIGLFLSFIPAHTVLTSPLHQSRKNRVVFSSSLELLLRIGRPARTLLFVVGVAVALVLGDRLTHPDLAGLRRPSVRRAGLDRDGPVVRVILAMKRAPRALAPRGLEAA